MTDEEIEEIIKVANEKLKRIDAKTENLCAELTRLRAIVARVEDVEGMAIFLCELDYPATGWKGTVESTRQWWRERASIVRDYLMGME